MWVRPMEESDIPEICRLENECFTDSWTEKMVKDMFANELDETFVAEDGGRIIGYVNVRIIADEAELMRICVEKESRGHGTGRLLMERALAAAQAKNVRNTVLEVRESNKGARALYEQNGFSEIARREGYYSNPDEAAIIMIR